MDKLIRLIVIFLGVVAVIVGAVGLVAPVSPGQVHVRCGSALAADLSEARARDDDRKPTNQPGPGGVLTETNFERLCQKDLTDRRAWTITLAAAGVLAIAAGLGVGAMVRRRHHGA